MKQYRIICEDSVRDFEVEVNNLLEKGYRLYGNPFSTEKEIADKKHQYYNQVMIITEQK